MRDDDDMGMPSSFTHEMALRICAGIKSRHEDSKRVKSLRDVCSEPDMPTETTVYKWLYQQPEFAEMYARAREERADMIAEDVIEIADTENDSAKARNRIDARKWAAAKLNPKRYADRTDSTTTHEAGAGMGALLAQLSAGSVFPKKTDESGD